jgi:predicted amidophosphoribosyltransferase
MRSLVRTKKKVKRPATEVRLCSYCAKRLKKWEVELCPACRRRLLIPAVGPSWR